ncbi:MAG TPA: TonB-dependent receptor, partial [Oleiagrimonas sp.]|nr:TonB-dependent receptor [Oleiagrimonas sp.]
SADSIYNPTNQDIGFYRRLVEAPSLRELTSRTRHLDATLKGWFMVGSHYWNWDAGVTWNKNTVSGVAAGNVNLRNAHRALGPSFINAEGVAKCGTPDDVIGGCIPWNVLGGPSAMTPELYQYLFVKNRREAGSKGVSYQANLTGGMFNIPFGGEAAFAFGVERREMSGYTEPDSLALAGLSTSSASPGMDASYSVNSVYGELSIPLLRDQPWAKNLTFDIAGRYSDYSTFGSTFNAKYGFEWKPIESLLFRGNYSEAYRSPSINNMYSGVHDYYVYFLDPCDTKYGADAYGDKVHNACIASLKAAGYANADSFRQVDATGNPVATANPVTTSRFHYGSNPDLDAEKAVTKTFGVVYSPEFAPGLDVSLDWYEIKIRDAIGQVTPQGTVENCYLGDASYCAKFHRNANGQLVSLHYGLGNMGKVVMEGYDFGIAYRLPATAFGSFKLTSNSSYLVRKNLKWGHDAPIDTQVGNNVWRLRNNTSLDWQYGKFGATWTIRYFSSVREPCDYMTECNMPDFVSPHSGAQPTRRIGAIAFNDLSVRWDAPWDARITLGVNNIFDREAPIQYGQLHDSGSIPFNPAYDLDRYLFMSYHQKF